MTVININEGSGVRLATVNAAVGKATRVRIVGVGDAVESVVLGVGVNDVYARAVPGGEWEATLPATLFSTAGRLDYSVDGYIEDECVYLGGGTVIVS